MSRNRSRRPSRKKPSSPRSAIQVVRSASPSHIAGSPPKRGFHIDWTQLNFWQFIILLLIPIVLTIIYVFPILDKHKQLRPEATIIAGSFLTTIGIVYGVLSTGVFRIKKINPFHSQKFKPKQAVLATISGILLSFLLLEIAMLPPPPQPITHPGPPLVTIPYPPYKGVLAFDGMQSRPSKGYYWQQMTDIYGSCKFVGSDYHVTANQTGFEICSAIHTNFHNFAFEVDMTFLKLGSAFILFEASNQIGYILTITSIPNSDYATLSLAVLSALDTQTPHVRGLIGPITITIRGQGPLATFAPGDTNRIAVVVNNQIIIPYVNGLTAPDWQKRDDSSTQGGIDLGALPSANPQDTQTEVVFSNARAWTL